MILERSRTKGSLPSSCGLIKLLQDLLKDIKRPFVIPRPNWDLAVRVYERPLGI